MEDRGIHIDRTYQLNFGGNMDFMNMLERSRLESKKISKTQAVTSQVDHDLGKRNVHVGPSDYVPWLDDLQVVLHPGRGPRLRRRAHQPGAQAGGLGLAELGRGGHRPVLRQARPRDRRAAARPGRLLHEVAAVQYTDDEARRLVEEFAAGAGS